MPILEIPANYYRQFDADYSLPLPAQGYGGWQKAPLPVDTVKTALVVMHAWDTGSQQEYPGWWRCVEYIGRSREISRTTLRQLVNRAREAGMRVIHVVGGHPYYTQCPGYQKAKALAGEPAVLPRISEDETARARNEFKGHSAFPGDHNAPDINRGWPKMNFLADQTPLDDEYVCENSEQLFAVCQKEGINHLVYTGFAINYCLTYSPGGMVDMSRRGVTCSAVRDCVTAVECRESIDGERNKEYGLWMTAMMFGFVYDLPDLLNALSSWN